MFSKSVGGGGEVAPSFIPSPGDYRPLSPGSALSLEQCDVVSSSGPQWNACPCLDNFSLSIKQFPIFLLLRGFRPSIRFHCPPPIPLLSAMGRIDGPTKWRKTLLVNIYGRFSAWTLLTPNWADVGGCSECLSVYSSSPFPTHRRGSGWLSVVAQPRQDTLKVDKWEPKEWHSWFHHHRRRRIHLEMESDGGSEMLTVDGQDDMGRDGWLTNQVIKDGRAYWPIKCV